MWFAIGISNGRPSAVTTKNASTLRCSEGACTSVRLQLSRFDAVWRTTLVDIRICIRAPTRSIRAAPRLATTSACVSNARRAPSVALLRISLRWGVAPTSNTRKAVAVSSSNLLLTLVSSRDRCMLPSSVHQRHSEKVGAPPRCAMTPCLKAAHTRAYSTRTHTSVTSLHH